MELNWRVSAVCAAAAFFISLLFGIGGGVQFGALILRAFIGAIVFAVLGAVGHQLMQKFLPELFQMTSAGETRSGENIDIVIQDREDSDSEAGESVQAEEPGIEAIKPNFHRGHNHVAESETEDKEPEDFDSLVEEIEEVAAPAEEIAAVKKRMPQPEEAVESVENVDALPELGSLESSFASPINEHDASGDARQLSGSSGNVDALGGGGGGGSGGAGGGQDPAHLAKVLQTILKKGNEG